MKKIIRALTLFQNNPSLDDEKILLKYKKILLKHDYEVQTIRVCTNSIDVLHKRPKWQNDIHLAVGDLSLEQIHEHWSKLILQQNLTFHLDLTKQKLSLEHVQILKQMTQDNPSKHFEFSYVFNNPYSSPFFPSAKYQKNGLAVGLQSTNLATGANCLEDWFLNMKTVWSELEEIFLEADVDFLGIDSSIAPLFQKDSSALYQMQKLTKLSFLEIGLSSTISKITKFLKTNNPKPVGLCGLMLPCLEDFELADHYQKGEFTLERNLFFSLQSGLGIDTYPLAINENPKSILRVLELVQALSNKYNKALSVRFICDGKAKVGEKTNFKNEYLKDVVLRPLM